MIDDLLYDISNGYMPAVTGRRFTSEDVLKLKECIDKRKLIEDDYQKLNLDDYFKYCINTKIRTK